MSAWREYVALWRASFDDADLGKMFAARFAILAVHLILISAVAFTLAAILNA